ncbi:hypothetical protein [Polymorphospora rubra]|uniref:hypothetical protein n=1 Tax=Polymorphospora rubra TaxID=338584 RepID=UPI0033D46149
MSMRRWVACVGLVVMTGAVGACGAGTTTDASGTPTSGPPTSADAVPTDTSASPSGPTSTATPAVLSGERQVTIVRVQSFESGLSLTDEGRLAETVDDSGRQLFVPTPNGETYLIKAYHGGGRGSGSKPVCWQVLNPGNSRPLVVEGADCRPDEPRQQFTVTAAEGGAAETFLISSGGAYLRTSAQHGLILEELGHAQPESSFRLVDNGPAPAGG